MVDKSSDISYRMTKPGIAAHPNLLVPKPFKNKPGAKPMYSISVVLDQDHPDAAPMKKCIMEAAKAKWPGLDISAEVKAGKLKVPFTQGDKLVAQRKAKLTAAGKEYKGDADFQAGKIVFKASTEFPVGLGVRTPQGDVDVTDDNKGLHKNAFYFGVECLVGVTFRAYDGVGEDGKPGVKAYLDLVHSLNRGKKLAGGSRSAVEAFKGVAGSAVGEDPTAGGDDDLPDGGEVF